MPTVKVRRHINCWTDPEITEIPGSTRIYRAQDPGLPLAPHLSPFFRREDYGLRDAGYEVLYVSPDRAGIEALRRQQGYFDQGPTTLVETTMEAVLRLAGPRAMVYVDTKLQYSTGLTGYVIIRPQ